jgi:glycyl-tRNA synthetase alpha subunit
MGSYREYDVLQLTSYWATAGASIVQAHDLWLTTEGGANAQRHAMVALRRR